MPMMGDRMRAGQIACILIALAWIGVGVPFAPAHAELATGGDTKFKEVTASASAILNEGLSSLSRFNAAIDSGNVDLANKYKEEAFLKLKEAASNYESAVQYGGDKELSPRIADDDDAVDVAYFYSHFTAYGISYPLSQKNV